MENQQQPPKGNININIETTPTLFSDIMFWNITPHGITLNFGQTIMGSNQVKIVSRIGVTREHLKKALDMMGKDIALTEVQGQTGKAKS